MSHIGNIKDKVALLSDRIYIMSGNPAGISAELVVEEPKPRNGEFLLSDPFMDYKRRIKRNFCQ